MRSWWVIVVAVAACTSDGSSPAPDAKELGAPPLGCEEQVGSVDQCSDVECPPNACGSWDCCYVADGEWRVLYTDCFEGCAGTIDAGLDAPVPPGAN